ncbi:MAG TPA: SRPBCC family protein [Saprospiraceae bacterium]|nr:SRPBCC family protein [Saprospiraceae bacterium]
MDKTLEISISVNIKAPASKVWRVLTDPELIKEYLFGTKAISEWKEGSPILFTGEWGGNKYEDKGVILTLEKDKIFQYSYWSSYSGMKDLPENYSVVSNILSESNEETILMIVQQGFKDQAAMDHTTENWKSVLTKIKSISEQLD